MVVTSDHGEGLGDHGEDEHQLFVYDSTLRVPLLAVVAGPAAGRPRGCAGQFRSVDLLPTLLELLGRPARAHERGEPRRGAARRRAHPRQRVLRGEPVTAAPLRLGAAAGAARAGLEVHRRPARRALPPRARTRARRRTASTSAARWRARCASGCAASTRRGRPPPRPPSIPTRPSAWPRSATSAAPSSPGRRRASTRRTRSPSTRPSTATPRAARALRGGDYAGRRAGAAAARRPAGRPTAGSRRALLVHRVLLPGPRARSSCGASRRRSGRSGAALRLSPSTPSLYVAAGAGTGRGGAARAGHGDARARPRARAAAPRPAADEGAGAAAARGARPSARDARKRARPRPAQPAAARRPRERAPRRGAARRRRSPRRGRRCGSGPRIPEAHVARGLCLASLGRTRSRRARPSRRLSPHPPCAHPATRARASWRVLARRSEAAPATTR